MKSIRIIILALAAAAALVSCVEKIHPDQSYSKITLPDGITIMLNDASAYEVAAHFTDATVSGIVAFVGNTESLPADYYSNLEVEISYGPKDGQQDNKMQCTLGTPEVDDWNAIVPFSAQIRNLQEAEYYLFTVKVTYASDKYIVSPEAGFFTFPTGPVDLDLESGNLWASVNLGAQMPEESGGFYAWGETQESEYYYWPFYKWCYWQNQDFALTKYCNYSIWGHNGFEDGKESLESDDDAAAKTLGGSWRIPSVQDWTELVEQANWKVADMGGVKGLLVRSKTNPTDGRKVIFLPFAGYFAGEEKKEENTAGFYWSSQVYESTCFQAYSLDIDSSNRTLSNSSVRCNGLSIRPVKSN